MILAVKRIFCLLILGLACHSCLAQERPSAIRDAILSMLSEGEHALDLIRNKGAVRTIERKIDRDEYGKVLEKRDWWPEAAPTGPLVDFQPVNTLHIKVVYEGTQLLILPIRESFYPKIRVDLQTAHLYLNNQVLTFEGEIHVSGSNNALNSGWHGYHWKSEKGSLQDSFQTRFTLGKLKVGGKIYMDIRWKEGDHKFHYRLLG